MTRQLDRPRRRDYIFRMEIRLCGVVVNRTSAFKSHTDLEDLTVWPFAKQEARRGAFARGERGMFKEGCADAESYVLPYPASSSVRMIS